MLRNGLLRITTVFLIQAAVAIASARAEPRRLSSSPILYIGDSISYSVFGGTMDTTLREFSSRVTTEASCGSSPANWLPQPSGRVSYAKTVCGFWKKTGTHASDEIRSRNYNTPQLEQELGSIHPLLTIVQLGTNIAANRNPRSAFNTVRQMLQDIKNSGSRCIWIGPPRANSAVVTKTKLAITDEMLSNEAEKIGFFYVHTLSMTAAPPTGDGIHPGPALARDWAGEVLKKIEPAIEQDLEHESP